MTFTNNTNGEITMKAITQSSTPTLAGVPDAAALERAMTGDPSRSGVNAPIPTVQLTPAEVDAQIAGIAAQTAQQSADLSAREARVRAYEADHLADAVRIVESSSLSGTPRRPNDAPNQGSR
jgi:hypothetical protein